MGRDKVLGLSLAILLIGFAGAFCFRNEAFVENGLKLARAKILDQAIAERPGPKPYTQEPKIELGQSEPVPVLLEGIEAFDAIPPQAMAQSEPSEQSPPSARSTAIVASIDNPRIAPSAANPSESPEARFDSTPPESPAPGVQDPFADDAPKSSMESITSSPVAGRSNLTIQPSPRRHKSATVTPQNVSWRSKANSDSADDATQSRREDAPPARFVHRVQRGDTLSRIAQRYLGDCNRYQEIFEANRDQLQSPDDRLRVGMSLRIPREPVKHVRTGPVASRRSPGYRSRDFMTGQTKTSRTRQAPVRNVSRVRDAHPPIGNDDQPPATKPPAGENDDNASPTPSPTASERFVPVRRSPFLPRNSGAGSQETGTSDGLGGRSLSQTPPDEPPAAEPAETSPDVSQFRFFPKGESPTVVSRRATVLR
jgi:nucleoid-associated protein YgaU